MTLTRHFFLFLCLALLSSMTITQGAPSGQSLQLQATPLWKKLSPPDDSSDTVLRRVKRQRRRKGGHGAARSFCDKFGCQSSRYGRNSGGCGSGFRFDRRSGSCRRLGK
ncbi:hypothetical protein JTE90_003514 [Oedothorax gibbosus]|uniref:Uncharacterized protein n=1 Tax=Oedothorax gibbosus TaxID=931172 RepID=A0AAV6THU4_9ARAC|nr:hypothetical protein JTE90_003514 [Oedothorax gibbosus]